MPKSVTYLEYLDSALDAGEYTIQLDQQLVVDSTGKLNENLARTLIVQGKRFSLDPSDIDSMFPAQGSAGDFTAVMPHIVLNLNTLPWQRSPDGQVRSGRVGDTPNYPWLALVVFNETDGIPLPKQLTLKQLYETWNGLAPWIRTQDGNDIASLDEFLEFGEKEDDPVTVIDVSRLKLEAILPSPSDMALLAHVRGESDLGDLSGLTDDQIAELAKSLDGKSFLPTIVANRLPKSGEKHSVHLVSLMYCFNEIVSDPVNSGFNAEQVDLWGSGDTFRLVSLYNWTFYCEDTGDFKEQLKGLNNNLLRLNASDGLDSNIAQYLEDGFALLPHHLRIGRDVASLYRGPLQAGEQTTLPFTLPVESADQLYLYDRKSGMLDVSYAAAWTLGRQLALEDKSFALDIYKYKRLQSIRENRTAAMRVVENLAVGKTDFTADDDELDNLKLKIQDWLDQYQTLQNIPFHYIIPQETFLPAESIRFFQINANWIKCLQYGALSIGGDLSDGLAISPNTTPAPKGFLLRSKVVSEFPRIRIQGFTENFNGLGESEIDALNPAPIIPQIKKLSDNLLFVYFSFETEDPNDTTKTIVTTPDIQTIEIFLDPANLYFGFREEGDESNPSIKRLVKDLKKNTGEEIIFDDPPHGPSPYTTDAVWRIDRNEGVLDVNTLAANMLTVLTSDNAPISADEKAEFGLFTSADFALQMVEGAPKVRFYIS